MGGHVQEVDYVVIGSGSAGAVIAARLSEDRDVSVLLLEAGPRDRNPILHLPAAARYAFDARRFNWSYESEPEPHLGGRRIRHPRGRVLGGSSSINGLVFLRGHPLDYEGWAEAGATGWAYADVLPYFRKLETRVDRSNPYQGDGGPVQVSTAARPNPISHAFLEACRQAGYPFSEDVNGYRQDGSGWFPMNAAKGLRWSAARAYLYDARRRANLDVQCGSHVDRIEFDGRRAVTVAWRRGNRPHQIRVGREVVLSAGAFNSPKLLMHSGIGDGDALKAHGIPVVQDLPGVGENLMDHPLTAIQVACRQPVSLAGELGLAAKARGVLRWLVRRDGLLASNHFECGAFIRSEAGVRFPDLQLYLFPIGVAEGSSDFMHEHGFQVQISTQRSRSRGWVRLASSDPGEAPRMQFNYLETERDWIELRAGFRHAREILAQPAMRDLHGGELSPGSSLTSDRDLDTFIRHHVVSSYHPCGTCRMGRDPMSVVDPECRVHGVEGLRVADASIMPLITSCNLNCPTLMIGEKAADLIAGRQPLPPSDLPYFVEPQWRTRQRQTAAE